MTTEIEATEVIDRTNLAVVAKVERLEAIPGKDRIELVHLADVGFTFICEKIHKVGDLVVYVKFDTIVPDTELFAFMKESKFRVKSKSFTERDENDEVIKKIYSQGIVLPIQKVLDSIEKPMGLAVFEGNDATEILGVRKYIPPTSGMGEMRTKGDFPTSVVSKTDETNLANKTKALEEIQGKAVYITLKIEGSSLTSFYDSETDELVVCSRNNILVDTEGNKFWQAVRRYDLFNKLKVNPDLIIQAECYGPGIQKNKLGIDQPNMAVFNLLWKKDRSRVNFPEVKLICEDLEIPFVPVIMIIDDFNMTFDELQEFADQQKYKNGNLAEGIVIRPFKPFISRYSKEPWSFKVLNREYKL